MIAKTTSFIEKLKSSGNGVCLLQGNDGVKKCWYYVNVDKLKLPILEAKVRAGNIVNLSEYGQVIISGWGVEPPELLKQRIQEFGANYDADSDTELENYYKSKSDVFYVSAQVGGQDCYYYIAVNGRLADEFRRICDEGIAADFSSFGNIIESGWGKPTPTIIAYMKEKYGVKDISIELSGDEYV